MENKPRIYKLVPVDQLQADATIEGPQKSYQLIGFEPSDKKRYVVSVEVGNASPKHVSDVLRAVQKQLHGFFPEGTVMFVPCRNGHPMLGLYELQLQE